MPTLLPDEGRKARCPICERLLDVVSAQVGCYVQCPHCRGKFRLFEADLIKPRRRWIVRRRGSKVPWSAVLVAWTLVTLALVAAGISLYWSGRSLLTARSEKKAPPSGPILSPPEVQVVSGVTTGVTELQQKVAADTESATQSIREGPFPTISTLPTQGVITLPARIVGPKTIPTQFGYEERVTSFPFVVYADCEGPLPFVPSGFMGDFANLECEECWTQAPKTGDSCIRVAYRGKGSWAGLAWQDPPDNWGDIPGGYNVSGATKLTFWARGDTGSEVAEFKVGLAGKTKKYADSIRVTSGKVQLSKDWKLYELPLQGLDLRRIITGFAIVVEAQKTPVVVYLDQIQYE